MPEKKKAAPKLSAASQKVLGPLVDEGASGSAIQAIEKRFLKLEQEIKALKERNKHLETA
jgi:hypothetical protein